MTSLAKFLRFCGFGVAITTLILAIAAIIALTTMEFALPVLIGLVAVGILFIFAVVWIALSYGLQREGEDFDEEYHEALEELRKFRAAGHEWLADIKKL